MLGRLKVWLIDWYACNFVYFCLCFISAWLISQCTTMVLYKGFAWIHPLQAITVYRNRQSHCSLFTTVTKQHEPMSPCPLCPSNAVSMICEQIWVQDVSDLQNIKIIAVKKLFMLSIWATWHSAGLGQLNKKNKKNNFDIFTATIGNRSICVFMSALTTIHNITCQVAKKKNDQHSMKENMRNQVVFIEMSA